MIHWYWILVAGWVGVGLGILISCLCVMAKQGDKYYYNNKNNKNNKINNIKYGGSEN